MSNLKQKNEKYPAILNVMLSSPYYLEGGGMQGNFGVYPVFSESQACSISIEVDPHVNLLWWE